jgi:beta-galactosidase
LDVDMGRAAASAAAAAAAAAAALLAPVAAQRTETSLNTGVWLFRPGDDLPWVCGPPTPTAADFDVDLSGVQLTGLNEAPAGGASPDACAAQCGCTCQAWQWQDGGGCWTGFLESLGPTNWVSNETGWVGGGRLHPAVPPAQAAGPAAPGFNHVGAGFTPVTLPHDYLAGAVPVYSDNVIEQRHGYVPLAPAWYVANLTVPESAAGGSVELYFGGAYRAATIFLNGGFLAHHQSGYTSFSVWLHNASTPLGYGPAAPNLLAVHLQVDAAFAEGWYFEPGGLHRGVTLITHAAPVRIVPHGVFVPAFLNGSVSAPAGPDGPQTADAYAAPTTDVANDGDGPAAWAVTTAIVGPDGAVAGSATSTGTAPPRSLARVAQTIALPAAALWFPAASPDAPDRPLYTAVTTVTVNGSTVVDAVNTTFGIRRVVFDPNAGLSINGFPLRIRGASMHADFAGCGAALPPRVHAYRVRRLQEMGGNGWRTAHQPVAEEMLAVADARGLMVWAENRFLRRLAPVIQDAADMVARDRNHPSIVIWSLCNENGCLEDPGMEGAIAPAVAGSAVASLYKDAMYPLDGTRPITANTHALIDEPGTILNALDVLGVTYDYDAYDTLHQARPFTPVMGGESGSCTTDRGFYPDDDDASGHVSSYGPLGCMGPAWTSVVSRPWVAGNFLWSGASYGGESSWPAVRSHYGVIDTAGFGTPSEGWYAAWWGVEAGHAGAAALVTVFPAWTLPGYEGKPVTVVAYAAAATVQLFVNGAPAGGGPVPMPAYGYVSWPGVVYAPGNLTVVSYASDGSVLGSATSVTAGPPASLALTVDFPGAGAGGALVGDGVDVALLRVAVVDAAGAVVPPANNTITFTVTGAGALYGVGNGDPACHTSGKAAAVSAYVGLARAIVQAASVPPGASAALNVTVTATSPGLPPATVVVPVVPPAAA